MNKTENCFLWQGSAVSRHGCTASKPCGFPPHERKACSTMTHYWLQSIGCSIQSNKNILLLVKDLFNEHVHSRFIFWAPSHRAIFINITLKTKLANVLYTYRTNCDLQSGHFHTQNTLQLPQFQIVVLSLSLETTGSIFWRIRQR